MIAWAEDQAITVGPWTIATSSRGDKFDSGTMSRSANDLDVSFIRDQEGLILLLESSKWQLERGHAYPVMLVERSGGERRRNDIAGATGWKHRSTFPSGIVFCKE